MNRGPRAHRAAAALSFGVVVAAVALVLVPAAATKGGSNGLEARVVATTKGPLPPCDPTPCSVANQVTHFIYVENDNKLEIAPGRQRSRATLLNSFVIDSVDSEIFVGGVSIGADSHYTPAPEPSSAEPFDEGEKFVRSIWGRWPSTVTCGTSGADYGKPDPCIELGKPAVIPGENTAVLYLSWSHASYEPAGTYEFKFTLHGTLNGEPIVLTASSKKIVMT